MSQMESLVRRLNALCEDQPFTTTWYLKDLATGESADRDGHLVIPSASTRKIAIMMAVFRLIARGELDLSQPLLIDGRYHKNDSGCFRYLTPGFSITLRDAITMMIVISDNVCTPMVVDVVGLDEVNAFCREIGMTGTTHRHGLPPALPYDHHVDATNTTTAADVGLLLDLIVQGAASGEAARRLGTTPELCQQALEIMSGQQFRSKLPSLLPSGTKVAHKDGTGVGGRDFSDVGVVYHGGEPRFILCAYTDWVPKTMPDGLPGHSAAKRHMGMLCRTCFDAFCR